MLRLTLLLSLYRVMAFNSLTVLIGNSSLPETRGTVNGYGQALCAIGRGLGPMVGATLFAWSEKTGTCTCILEMLIVPMASDLYQDITH